jgi:hypothetical protein
VVRPTVIPKSLKPKMIQYKSLMLSLQILVIIVHFNHKIKGYTMAEGWTYKKFVVLRL